MQKVIVTGGAGFIGANYIHSLFADPAFKGKVLNIDVLTYAGNLQSLEELEARYGKDRYFFEQADICDAPRVNKIFHEFQADTVVNFAAESHVDRSIDGPMQFVQTNVMGTATLLSAALEWYKNLAEEGKNPPMKSMAHWVIRGCLPKTLPTILPRHIRLPKLPAITC